MQENTVERLRDIIIQDDANLLLEELNNLHYADIAEIFEEFSRRVLHDSFCYI